MALKKSISKPISKIKYLKQKLDGKLPVTYEDLLILVTSHGVNKTFEINIFDNIVIEIEKCEPNQCYDLSKLDTSKITNMYSLFAYNNFNGDISNWDVSNVTNMRSLFYNSKFFNSNISNWNVSKVTNMRTMFLNTETFNQDISNWNTSKVINMEALFYGAENFNQPIGKWNTSKVTDMDCMFCNARAFNQPLNWDTSKVTNMKHMFYNTLEFNQPLNFDTSNVTNIKGMFSYAIKFNQPLNFDISKVTTMSYMFANTIEFNQNISKWNLDKVEKCNFMFDNANAFLDKYNSGEPLPTNTNDIKDWFNLNRDRMNDIDTKNKYGKEIDDFFYKIENKK